MNKNERYIVAHTQTLLQSLLNTTFYAGDIRVNLR